MQHILWVTSLEAAPDAVWAFEQKLKPIFKNVLDLRIALGEQFTSADITPFAVTSGTPFIMGLMEDALSDARSSGKDSRKTKNLLETAKTTSKANIVVATVGIGLKQRISNPTCHEGGREDYVILAPKVILQSTLTDLLKPFDPLRKGQPIHLANLK